MQRRQATLKEKLSEHYRKRDFKAKKQTASTAGIVFFLGMLFTLVLEGLVVLLPNHFMTEDGEIGPGYRWAQLFCVWLFLETALNWYNTYYDIANRVTKEMKSNYYPVSSETPPGWKNCPTCMMDAPPRSYHCTLCNHCILKRDQHCFVTGSCVGYHNQRTFVVFCIYVLISTVYAAYLQFSYLNKMLPFTSHWASFYFPLTGLWQYLIGAVSFMQIFILIHLCCTLVSLGLSAFFLFWQMVVISRGQTSFEAWKQIMIYRRRAVLDNFRDVFGDLLTFLLCLVVPLRMHLPGDGVKWVIEPKAEKGH
ncbi:palmitoyltransferase [Plakobranchus ocellatus]|uniref:Palmitoyltransferase n=1 Tax=Plakobranchus ocellatus TaxID=259542 RepID=A0AAV4E2L1_9GAST|nr:palmitoyltransferase [Plakobranchus ocellatus]